MRKQSLVGLVVAALALLLPMRPKLAWQTGEMEIRQGTTEQITEISLHGSRQSRSSGVAHSRPS
jgi:hypothetical protein